MCSFGLHNTADERPTLNFSFLSPHGQQLHLTGVKQVLGAVLSVSKCLEQLHDGVEWYTMTFDGQILCS